MHTQVRADLGSRLFFLSSCEAAGQIRMLAVCSGQIMAECSSVPGLCWSAGFLRSRTVKLQTPKKGVPLGGLLSVGREWFLL